MNKSLSPDLHLELPNPNAPLLELTEISRSYRPDEPAVLDHVSLSVFPGELIAIVGPSGSGKSTLLNIIGLLDSPTSGTYQIHGQEVGTASETEKNTLRSHGFGFVFQSANVLGEESALANVEMGMRVLGVPTAERHQRAAKAMERVGLATKGGQLAKLLSGGERQRVAIARALVTDPEVILADEPTGNLDTTNSRVIMELLRDVVNQGTTVIVITHDPEIADLADRQFKIRDGKLDEITPASARDQRTQTRQLSEAAQTPSSSTRGKYWRAWRDDVTEALSSLSSRPTRTILLILAFALGIGGLIASVGLSTSASGQVTNRLTAAALDEVRVMPDTQDSSSGALLAQANRLAALPHVQQVGYLNVMSAAQSKVSRLGPGLPPPDEALTVATASPQLLTLADISVSPAHASALLGTSYPCALLSEFAARVLGVTGPVPEPGTSVWINGLRVSVVGIFSESERLPELGNSVLIPASLMDQFSVDGGQLIVRTEPGYPAIVAKAVPLQLAPQNPGAIRTQTVADLQNLRLGVANDLAVLVGVLSAVLIALAIVSATATMYLTVQARAAEIGLRRAIGASKGAIAKIFLGEGVLVGVAGGILGVALGMLGILVGCALQGWSAILPPNLPWIALGLGVVTGLVSSLYPAFNASRREPAAVLRG